MKEQRFEKVTEYKFKRGDLFDLLLPALIFSPFIGFSIQVSRIFNNYFILGYTALMLIAVVWLTKQGADIYKNEYWRLIE